EFFADHHSVVYYQSITALTLARRLKHKDQPLKVLVIANPTTGDSSDDQSGSQTVTEDRKAEVDRLIESQYRGKRQDEEGLPEQSLLSLQTYNRLSAAFGPLPVTEELAKDLQAQFGENADVYSRAQATMAAFREEIIPKINRYDKIIFATHGYAGDEFRPEIEEPFLVLSLIQPRSDNLLRMSAVMDLPLNADLVTLIACQSGLGKQISGEGTMGMGRAFQYAGSKSVLMSLWSVEEKASVQLVRTLLEQTSKGADKLEALKRARDQLRQTGWDHPFFWAAFVLVGEGN
ncbi:MAG: CHAT domain-containing protein, partial [Deltaproteobacteria bacterium]|nr:CHAT domain-containing protein [Deltaproteobacteria bacterium]